MTDFGPAYHKIETFWKRGGSKFIVIPGAHTLPEFEYLTDNPWLWTEKIDGTNIRLHWDGKEVTIGGRTDRAQIPANLLAALKDLTNEISLWEEKFGTEPGTSVTIFGEGYGAGIQKGGGRYRDTPGFIVFDVQVGDWYLQKPDVEDVAKFFGMDVVPSMGTYSPSEVWCKIANGELVSFWPKVTIEGVVGVPLTELRTRRGHRMITKMKLVDYENYCKYA